jgi:transmembrane sensor
LNHSFNHTANDVLLAKYLSGEASAEEAIEVEEWLATSGDSKKYFDDFVSLYNAVNDNAVVKPVNVQLALEKVRLNITDTNKQRQPFVSITTTARIRILKATRVAAALAAIFFGGALLFYFLRKQPTDVLPRELAIVKTIRSDDAFLKSLLPDSSQVVLTAGSRLEYDSSFGKQQREINFSGEGFFNVQHIPDKPFVIHMGAVSVQVLGTSFNINARAPGEGIEVSVHTGRVRFYDADGNGLILEKGNTGIYSSSTGQFSKNENTRPNAFAYATGELVFKNTTLKEVIDDLEKTYAVRFKFENTVLEKCTLTFTFNNASLGEVISLIAETLNLQFQKTDTVIIIKGNGC